MRILKPIAAFELIAGAVGGVLAVLVDRELDGKRTRKVWLKSLTVAALIGVIALALLPDITGLAIVGRDEEQKLVLTIGDLFAAAFATFIGPDWFQKRAEVAEQRGEVHALRRQAELDSGEAGP